MVIREDSPESLDGYGEVPIAFEVRARLSVADLPLLVAAPTSPWTKDYDAIESPAEWPRRFDLTRWIAISAWEGDLRIGSAIVARDTPGVDLLEGRDDLAVLWDLRVRPGWRGQGVGRRLFDAAAAWARRHGCIEMRVETQDINVPACRFYSAMGCTIGSVDPQAYELDEVQIVWRIAL